VDSRRIVSYALVGAGVAGLGVGTFFGLRAMSKNDDAEERCPNTRCNDREGVSLAEEASDAATISNVAFGLGLAALAGGVVLYLTAPGTSDEAAPIAASFGPSGISLKGSF
jgi:serine/threonine-protein kinase